MQPSECVAHWLADSVEFLIDPRGNSSAANTDTASTFKLGVFPFTNDPANFNGNGVNGPCWSRDADNHQGYATGPLQSKVHNAPERAGRAGRLVGDVGREQQHVDAARLHRRRLRPRGQDPDGGPARRGRSGPDGPEHHALRQRRQQRERRAAPHRPGPDARRLVGVRERAVRPVPLGHRDAARLHAAAGPADGGAGRRRVQPEPQRRALAADDRAVRARRRADRRPRRRRPRTIASRS